MTGPRPAARRRPVRHAAAGGLALALLSSVVGGCGGSKPSDKAGGAGKGDAPAAPALVPSGPQPQACALLTQAEVEAAVGAKATPGRAADQGVAGTGCSYSLASGADQSVLVVAVASPGSPAAFDAARQRATSAEPVSAGDRAFVTGGEAVVLKGTTLVTILVVTKQPGPAQTQAASRLAQAAATHL